MVISYDQSDGRTLLLFYYGNVNMGYQIVTIKIYRCNRKSHPLFFDGDLLFIFDSGDGNYPYLSLRKSQQSLS